MAEKVMHYYDVILGRCGCGAQPKSEAKNFTVFVDQVTCPTCRAHLNGKAGKSDTK